MNNIISLYGYELDVTSFPIGDGTPRADKNQVLLTVARTSWNAGNKFVVYKSVEMGPECRDKYVWQTTFGAYDWTLSKLIPIFKLCAARTYKYEDELHAVIPLETFEQIIGVRDADQDM